MPLQLANFVKWVIHDGCFDGCDLDGGDIQDRAIKAGILVEEKYDPNKHGPNEYDIAPGEEFYVLSDEFKSALAAEKE